MKQEIFSRLPVPTWRWLGVNEALLPAGLGDTAEPSYSGETAPGNVSGAARSEDHRPAEPPDVVLKRIRVPAGETEEAVFVWRGERRTRVQAIVGEGATLNLICIQMLPQDKAYAGEVAIEAGEHAGITFTAVEAGASQTVTTLQVNLAGDDSAADVAAVYFGDKKRKIDLNYIITQAGKRTEANMQVRGVLKDECDKIFRGTLDFRRGSKGSTGREKEEIILFSEGIRNRSVPLMLSGEDEVSGHHAVSAGRINKEKLFYLMSRGLDGKEAQKLLTEAMLAPVLKRIPSVSLQEEIAADIEERIADGQS